ncbi:MAG: serine/threonine protein kinase [Actinomycetaceae bacterium]|nr:serine/threonine protein kinase [Actinomycetaceae bacterium]
MTPHNIGGYKILKTLGSGGMSTVYEAENGNGEHVALKVLSEAYADATGRERLAREVQLMLGIDSDAIARIIDAETDDSPCFIVTELIDGLTLDKDVSANGLYEGDDLVHLATELYDAIQTIHTAGVLHRDLKPSNVIISSRGPVIIDFGISMLETDTRLTTPGNILLTPGYCDPRIINNNTPDEEADLWALAAVLLFAATGEPPFGTGNTQAIFHRVLTGDINTTGLEPHLARAFTMALAPENRMSFPDLLECLKNPDHITIIETQPAQTSAHTAQTTRLYSSLPSDNIPSFPPASETIGTSEYAPPSSERSISTAPPEQHDRSSSLPRHYPLFTHGIFLFSLLALISFSPFYPLISFLIIYMSITLGGIYAHTSYRFFASSPKELSLRSQPYNIISGTIKTVTHVTFTSVVLLVLCTLIEYFFEITYIMATHHILITLTTIIISIFYIFPTSRLGYKGIRAGIYTYSQTFSHKLMWLILLILTTIVLFSLYEVNPQTSWFPFEHIPYLPSI